MPPGRIRPDDAARAHGAAADPAALRMLPLRLAPGDELRGTLQSALAAHGAGAAFVLAGIGSLRPCLLRLAGAQRVLRLDEDVEILTLCGSLGRGGSHLHISVSLPDGRVLGGHAAPGCTVRTTAELLLGLLPGWRFTREHDARTGYAELLAQALPPARS